MSSAVHPTTDIAKILRQVRFVPSSDSCTAAKIADLFEPLAAHIRFERPKAREVAARPREVCHKAAVDGLVRGVVCRLQNMYWPPFKWMACPLTKLPVVQS